MNPNTLSVNNSVVSGYSDVLLLFREQCQEGYAIEGPEMASDSWVRQYTRLARTQKLSPGKKCIIFHFLP